MPGEGGDVRAQRRPSSEVTQIQRPAGGMDGGAEERHHRPRGIELENRSVEHGYGPGDSALSTVLDQVHARATGHCGDHDPVGRGEHLRQWAGRRCGRRSSAARIGGGRRRFRRGRRGRIRSAGGDHEHGCKDEETDQSDTHHRTQRRGGGGGVTSSIVDDDALDARRVGHIERNGRSATGVPVRLIATSHL